VSKSALITSVEPCHEEFHATRHFGTEPVSPAVRVEERVTIDTEKAKEELIGAQCEN
jgi:hypothetical protein